MTDTAALHSLRAWMTRKKERTQAWLARRLNVKPPSVNSWLSGHTRPEPHLRTALKEIAGIDEGDWWTEEERAALERVRDESTRPSDPDPKAA